MGALVLSRASAADSLPAAPIYDGPELDYQPAIIRQEPSGRLLVVFERLTPSTLSGDLYVTYSDTAGGSWSTPEPAVASERSERHPALVQLDLARYALFYCVEEGVRGAYRIHRATSVDGLRWEDEGPIDLGWADTGEINPSVAKLADGSLGMAYHRYSGRAYFARSTDGGATWDQSRTPITVSNAALPRIAFRESDGRLVVTYQTNPGDNQLNLWMKTTLDPMDWEKDAVAVSLGRNSHDSVPLVLADGSLAVFYAHQVGSAFDLFYRASDDLEEFSEEVRLTTSPTKYDTQPHPLLMDEAGAVALVWSRQQSAQPYRDHDVWFAGHVEVKRDAAALYLPYAAVPVAASAADSGRAASRGATSQTGAGSSTRDPRTSPVPFETPREVSQLGGQTRVIELCGEHVYLGVGPRLVVVDVADPGSPKVVWRSGPLPGIINDLLVRGDRAFATVEGAGFRVFDLTDPARPVEVGQLSKRQRSYGFAVSGDRAYVAARSEGLQVVDVSVDALPREVALVGVGPETSRGLADVLVSDGLAYAISSEALIAFSLEQPDEPRLVGSVPLLTDSRFAELLGTKLLLGGRSRLYVLDAYLPGTQVVDISDPSAPRLLELACWAPRARDAVLQGELLYFAGSPLGSWSVSIMAETAFDVAPGGAAWACSSIPVPVRLPVGGVETDGTYLYAASTSGGLHVIRLGSRGYDSTEIAFVDVALEADRLAVAGHHVYAVEPQDLGLVLDAVSVLVPSRPRSVGELRWTAPGGSDFAPQDIAVSNGELYIAASPGGLTRTDVSDPATPTGPERVSLSADRVSAVAASDELLFCVSGSAGDGYRVHVVDLADRDSAREVGYADIDSHAETPARAVAAWGSYAAVALPHGLFLVDASAPAEPQVGLIDSMYASDVVYHDGMLAVVGLDAESFDSVLRIFDVSEAASPRLVSSAPLADRRSLVAATRGKVVVVGNPVEQIDPDRLGSTLEVFDVADPSRMRKTHSSALTYRIDDIGAADGYAYLLSRRAGLVTLQVAESARSEADQLFLPIAGAG